MAKNTSMEPCFSLNGSHLPQPIAESTCVSHNGCSWVNAPLSPQHRSYSNGCLTQTPKSAARTMAATNGNKIDARTYTDVQSNGLTSRIVQYHNKNGSRLNRSTSLNTLYSRPGQFPVVHLRKTEMPVSAGKRHQISMTRIAPPEKSLFYGDTLSGLLRFNSIVRSNQKNDRKFSHENRPIIHPPPTEDDTMPTRSVLDVLKDLSRKRINSEDDEGRMEASMKKYCNREGQQQQLDPTAMIVNQQQQNWQRIQNNNYKRPREQTMQPNSIPSSPNSATRKPAAAATTTASPEQTAKLRRLSNFNNDITSSLSSSQIYANKRKLYDSPQSKKSPSDESDMSAQRFKVQRQKLATELPARSMNSDAYTPITPIPPTPQVNAENRNIKSGLESMHNMSTTSLGVTTPIKAKPRVTLFNKNYEIEEKSVDKQHDSRREESNVSSETSKDDDDNSYAEIQFVRPKKGDLLSGNKHPLIQRTQKSKLALMLCGLRGELYQGDEVSPPNTPAAPIAQTASATSNICADVLDTPAKTTTSFITPAVEEKKQEQSISLTTLVKQPQPVPSVVPSNQLTPPPTTTTTLPIINTTPKTTAVSETVPAVKKTTSPLVGIKLTPIKAIEPNFNITPINMASNATTSITTTTTTPSASNFQFGLPTMPKLKMGTGTFNFGTPNNANEKKAPESNAQTNNWPAPTGFAAFGMPNTQTPAAPVMSFNMPTSAATITTTSTLSMPQKTLSNAASTASTMFSFGSEKSISNTNPTTTATTAPAPTPALFAFGGNETGQNKPDAGSGFSFGSASNTQTPSKPTASAAPFSLNNTTIKTNDEVKSNTNTTPLAGGFSFSQINDNNNKGFTFGTNTNTSSTSSVFGSNVNTTPVLGFGGNTDNKSPTTSGFNLFNNNQNQTQTNVSSTPATMTNFTKSAFTFGNNTTTTPTNNNVMPVTATNANNLFGANTTQGGLKTTFSFGGSTNNNHSTTNNENNNNNATSLGGSTSSNFTFGGLTAQGGAASKTFTFGTTTATTSSNNNNVPNIFGATTTPAPSFGSLNSNVSSVAPFNFENNKPMDNAAKPFTFGNAAAVAAPTPTPTAPMSFNFAANPAALPSISGIVNNNNNNNMFSPAASNDRPIRRATRRLNKP